MSSILHTWHPYWVVFYWLLGKYWMMGMYKIYLKVTFICVYKILWFDYPSHFARTNNSEMKNQPLINYSDFAPIKVTVNGLE